MGFTKENFIAEMMGSGMTRKAAMKEWRKWKTDIENPTGGITEMAKNPDDILDANAHYFKIADWYDRDDKE